jgi:hypothetical protein
VSRLATDWQHGSSSLKPSLFDLLLDCGLRDNNQEISPLQDVRNYDYDMALFAEF